MPPDLRMGDPTPAGATTAAVVIPSTVTVEAGARYMVRAFTLGGAITSGLLLSATGVTSTAANIEWVCPIGESIIITIPIGKTTLYAAGESGVAVISLSKLQ